MFEGGAIYFALDGKSKADDVARFVAPDTIVLAVEETLKQDLFTIDPYERLGLRVSQPLAEVQDWKRRGNLLLVAHDEYAPNDSTVIELATGRLEVLTADFTLLRDPDAVLRIARDTVQHTPADGNVRVDVEAGTENVRIRVIDTGPGIAAADAARVFDRFVQLDPSRRAEGSGLGLPIARWIAEAHRGSLVVESTGREGATFCVTLPLNAVRGPAEAAESSSVHVRIGSILSSVSVPTDR